MHHHPEETITWSWLRIRTATSHRLEELFCAGSFFDGPSVLQSFTNINIKVDVNVAVPYLREAPFLLSL